MLLLDSLSTLFSPTTIGARPQFAPDATARLHALHTKEISFAYWMVSPEGEAGTGACRGCRSHARRT
jgi:hypothetical protein